MEGFGWMNEIHFGRQRERWGATQRMSVSIPIKTIKHRIVLSNASAVLLDSPDVPLSFYGPK